MAYGCTITVNAGQIPSSQSNFVWWFSEVNLPTAAIDGGSSSILNGGGNLRCYTDSTKTTQLPLDVVTFVTGGSPQVQVWGLSSTLADGSTVYIEADSVAISQPAVTDAYGRNAVWTDYEAVIHANETGTNGIFIDSTGNGHDTTLTTGVTLPTVTTNNPFGTTWPDFYTSQGISLANSYDLINNSAFTMSAWIDSDYISNNGGVFGSRYNSPDTQWAQIQASGRVFTKASSVENFADSSSQTIGLRKLKQNNTSLDSIYNGALDRTDTTITSGESINNTTVSHNFRIGTYYDNSKSRRFNGRASEFRIKRSKDTASFDTAEYNNQSAPNLFWSTSAWVDSGGGGVTLLIDSGAYTLSGASLALSAQYKTQTISGSYSFTGTSTNLIVDRKTLAGNGSYSLSGSPTNLKIARNTIAAGGTYNLTGTDVTLIYTPSTPGDILTIESGTFSLSGATVGFITQRVITIESGSYSLNGQQLTLTTNRNTSLNSGSYALTGSNLALKADYGTITSSGAYSLNGASVVLRYSGDIVQEIGTVKASFAGSDILTDYVKSNISTSFKVNSTTVSFKG